MNRASHAAALRYVDSQLPLLLDAFKRLSRPAFAIVTSDHGTAYGRGRMDRSSIGASIGLGGALRGGDSFVSTFREFLAAGGLFQGYAYAYPHKTSYRALQPPVSLSEAWCGEDKSSLFLYAHVPFCSMRCGFCNLFTMTHPGEDRVSHYLNALERQAIAVSDALGDESQFSRVALGGGTPTFLHTKELDALFGILHRSFRIQRGSPTAVELSPATATLDRLSVLRDYGTTRVSLGVQSFVEAEDSRVGAGPIANGIARCSRSDYGRELPGAQY
jgi:hypothetical protein